MVESLAEKVLSSLSADESTSIRTDEVIFKWADAVPRISLASQACAMLDREVLMFLSWSRSRIAIGKPYTTPWNSVA
jgi:hypothetical protein